MHPAQRTVVEERTGFSDELMICSESYSLWAIQSSSLRVSETLSFSKADQGVVIAPDINKFRELKLRLLNGTHTFTSGLAVIAGLKTVKEAMDDAAISAYIENLMLNEIGPQIVDRNLAEKEMTKFSMQVLDRFRNPHIEHPWLNITVQYSSKMRMRNVPMIEKYYNKNNGEVPELMALGFAAHLLFMKCEKDENGKYYGRIDGVNYAVEDDNAAWFADKWAQGYSSALVQDILSDAGFWGINLDRLPGFTQAVEEKLGYLLNGNLQKALKGYQVEKVRV
jgi:tagaturonate reductase